MKIVDYDTFIRMPSGTIFAPYKPCVFDGRFEIKVDGGCENKCPLNGQTEWYFNGTMSLEPWFSTEPYDWPDKVGTYETEMSIYDGSSVDAMDHKMFAIMEPHEVTELIKALCWALAGCPGEFGNFNIRDLAKMEKYKEDV